MWLCVREWDVLRYFYLFDWMILMIFVVIFKVWILGSVYYILKEFENVVLLVYG